MDIVTGVLTSAAVLAVWLWIGVRSYRRNIEIYGRRQGGALLVAAAALYFAPVTLLYWLFGPTPERMMRRHRRDQAWYHDLRRRTDLQ